MLDINIYDLLVFEDEAGNIYQDCVCDIGINLGTNKVDEIECNQIKLYLDTEGNVDFIDERFGSNTYKLKEIWHRTDEDTYKKVWDKIKEEEKLTGKNLFKTYKLFKEDKFEELETYKGHIILKASLNHHNSEYVIKDLGFDTRFSSLSDCKKYIKLFLCKESLE